MSAATMSGSDAVKASSTGSKQQLKSSGSAKALDSTRKQAASPVEGQSRKQQQPQQKAWQGTNPITQRPSSVIANGTEKPLPKAPAPQTSTKSTTESNVEKHANDRALYLISNLTGTEATLTLKNGEQFTGIFSGGSFDSSKPSYTLKMVKRIRLPTQQQINGATATELPNEFIGEGEDHVMTFDKDDTVDLSVLDVTLAPAQPVQNGSISSSFRTDTEISGRDPSMPRERELQRWEPGADSTIDMSLEDSGEAGWDQFAINERMYGVSSTYDENIYTTQIDRSDPRYKQREAEAARIAREIEGSAPVNAHVAEERRRDTDRGDGLDEEEKYSGVKRDPALPRRAAGAYVPPSQRPITNMPTVPGAPYDPAIISSQLVKPASQLSPEKAADQARAIEPVAGEEQNATSTETVAKDSKSIAQPTQPPKKPAENTTEDHVRNVTDSFKQFANNEKLRLRLAQEQKRSAQRAEKNVKLNDLKKFAENFKLRSRVPDDLVPILAKDREKQIEIQHKADEAAKEEAVKSKEREREKTAGASSPAPSSASHAGVVDPRLQFTPYSKARVPGNVRGQQPLSGQTQPPRQPAGGQQNRAYAHPAFPPRPQPLPTDLRIPTGPAIPPTDVGPLSPTSATRLNVNAKAFEFRPAASAFTPTGATPSPQRSMAGSDHPAAPETADFFSKDKKPVDTKEKMDLDELFNPIQRMLGEATEEQKNALISTGGVPQPYRTPPTWPREDSLINTSYLDLMPKSAETSRPQSQMHTPNPNTAQMPHAHQLPPHMQGAQVSTPSQRPPYLPPPHHHHQQPYGPGMQQFGPNGSVQSSPRFQPPQMAFNGQMPAMPMPQFAGQMQPYGMSPNMQYRQPNIPPQGPMMMMGPGQGHAQMGQMPPGYPRGPNQFTPQMMGGVPMANQPSGGFMGGPIPQQQSYSPMPHHATPHMQHMQPGGYTGSPRPPMMQQTASHQGFQPNPMHMGHPPPPHFAPSPATGPAHPYHLQQRQMSGPGAYHPHMTPRQQQVVPMQHSPGMVGSHGDEGK